MKKSSLLLALLCIASGSTSAQVPTKPPVARMGKLSPAQMNAFNGVITAVKKSRFWSRVRVIDTKTTPGTLYLVLQREKKTILMVDSYELGTGQKIRTDHYAVVGNKKHLASVLTYFPTGGISHSYNKLVDNGKEYWQKTSYTREGRKAKSEVVNGPPKPTAPTS